MRLPWIGSASVAFRKRIQCLTRKAVPFCDAIISFTSRALIHPFVVRMSCRLRTSANVTYLFTCGCGRRYVGRTSQRLGDRVKQHLPRKLINSERRGLNPTRNNNQYQRGPKAMEHLRKWSMVPFHLELGVIMLVLPSWQ